MSPHCCPSQFTSFTHCVSFSWLVTVQSSDLDWAMFSALVGNKPQFVSLLLENGVSLRDFLQDEETLCKLYRQLPGCSFLNKLAKRVENSSHARRKVFHTRTRACSGEVISMSHVSDEVRHLLGSFTQPLYPPSSKTNHFNVSMDSSASVSLFIRHRVICLQQ